MSQIARTAGKNRDFFMNYYSLSTKKEKISGKGEKREKKCALKRIVITPRRRTGKVELRLSIRM